ncbi:MAG: hypothetical protein ACTSVV_11245, partial [Promethearchaeota archaeon]
MKSNDNDSEPKLGLERATELVWKVWWFFFYILILPTSLAVLSFYIFIFFFRSIIPSIDLSIITFLSLLLFFYKFFDKYRKRSYFKNKKNNLDARIHILFLIITLSYITILFLLIVLPESLEFNFFPLISFIIFQVVMIYYYNSQPIDYFDDATREFEKSKRVTESEFLATLEGEIYQANNATFSLFKYPQENFIGMSFIDFFSKVPEVKEKVEKALIKLKEGKKFTFKILPIKRKDGIIIWVNLSMEAIKYDENMIPRIRFRAIKFIEPRRTRFHNLILVFNFIIQVLFLTFTLNTKFSWIFALITTIFFYFISIKCTHSIRHNIKEAINKEKDFLHDLILYKEKFVSILLTSCFVLLMEIPIIILIFNCFQDTIFSYLDYFNTFVYMGICLLFYFKIKIDLSFYYKKLLTHSLAIKPKSEKEIELNWFNRLQFFNFLISTILICSITLFLLLIDLHFLIFIFIIIFIVITYYEQRADFYLKKYSRHLILISLIIIDIIFCFLIIPSLFKGIGLNLQFLFSCIGLFVILQFFIKLRLYKKESLLIFQHLLVVAIFFIIAYYFFPVLSDIYLEFIFIPEIIIISTILLHSLIILLISLGSLYYLYARHFYKKPNKLLKIILINNFSFILLIFYSLIVIKFYFSFNFETFINLAIISLMIFPVLFSFFIILNYNLYLFSKKESLTLIYYNAWLFVSILFAFITLLSYPNVTLLLMNFILFFPLFSISSIFLLIFGYNINKISTFSYMKYTKIITFLIACESFIFLTSLFMTIFQNLSLMDNIILSTYFSVLIINIVIYLGFRKNLVFTKPIIKILTGISLIYTTIIASYFTFYLTSNTFYIYNMPLLVFTFLFSLTLIYFKKSTVSSKFLKNLIIINVISSCLAILALPSITHLQLLTIGIFLDLITTINFTLYILHVMLFIFCLNAEKLKIRKTKKLVLLKSQVILEIFIIFTSIFYYSYKLLIGTILALSIPLILTSGFLFIPMLISHKKNLFKLSITKITLIINSFFIWACFIILPLNIGFELNRLGINVNFNIILLFILAIIFSFSHYLGSLFKYLNLKQQFLIIIKAIQIIIWILLSSTASISFLLLTSIMPLEWFKIMMITIAFLAFFALNTLNLYQIKSLSRKVVKFKETSKYHFWIQKIFEYYKNINYFGITISLSSFILLLLQPIYHPFLNTISKLGFSIILIDIVIFCFVLLSLIRLSSSRFKIEFLKVKSMIEALSWLTIKLVLSIIVAIISVNFSLFTRMLLVIGLITFLTPLTLFFLKSAGMTLKNKITIINKIVISLFFMTSIIVFLEREWILLNLDPHFSQNVLLSLSTLICLLFPLSNYMILKIKKEFYKEINFSTYKFYGSIIILLFSLLYYNSFLILITLLLSSSILLSSRNINIFIRFIIYLLLSYINFTFISAILINQNILSFSHPRILELLISLFIIILTEVLSISVILHVKRNNTIEEFAIYSLLSILLFILLNMHAIISTFYNITITFLLFLSFLSLSFYKKKDPRYRWFLKTLVLLSLFDFTSLISSLVLFASTQFTNYQLILNYSFSIGLTCLSFTWLYNKSPTHFRKISFFIALTILTLSFPIFSYFLLVALYSTTLFNPFFLIISINIGIFLFYFSIGIYQWKISWLIWKVGWWLWIIFPFVNFYLIYSSLTGIDLYTNALVFFGTIKINGSFIIS